MRAALALAAAVLAGCAAPEAEPQPPPQPAAPPPFVACRAPTRPPYVPPSPRTTAALGAWGWAEAMARNADAASLRECARNYRRLHDWIEQDSGR